MSTDVRLTRVHKTLKARATQLHLNQLAIKGGAPYLNKRLTRFPCESDVSWDGDSTLGVIGRKHRAYLINYAGRVATKFNQFLFSVQPQRAGIEKTFAADVTKTGLSIAKFFDSLSELYTAAQWAWVCVDRSALQFHPVTKEPIPRTIAQREKAGDRIFWTAYPPDAVVDWRYAADGSLARVITEESIYDNEDETVEPTERKVRTIWKPGTCTQLWLSEQGTLQNETTVLLSANIVPFVCLGLPSADPHWYDDVERIQAALANLESAHNENLIKAVYPQLVIPEGIIERIMELANIKADKLGGYKRAVEMARGLDYPIVEPTEANGITRYLTPTASDLTPLPDNIKRLRAELYDVVGMAMNNKESREAQTAESKQWDHLDMSATLAHRATELEDVERKCVELSVQLDSSFPKYTPVYNRDFDISDPATDFRALLELDNYSNFPDGARREVARALVNTLNRMVKIDPKRFGEIMKEIDTMDLGPTGADMFNRIAQGDDSTPPDDEEA